MCWICEGTGAVLKGPPRRIVHSTTRQPVIPLPFPRCWTSLLCGPSQGPIDYGDALQLLEVGAVLSIFVYFCSLHTWAEAGGSLPRKTVGALFSWQRWETKYYSKIIKENNKKGESQSKTFADQVFSLLSSLRVRKIPSGTLGFSWESEDMLVNGIFSSPSKFRMFLIIYSLKELFCSVHCFICTNFCIYLTVMTETGYFGELVFI